ncbi:AAA family ATPase [Actinospica durhamensis]|uniref:AAA family ATPase n=1 Tax=Actinospica durhamensis TaxID=1508375 RepID=A0A941IQS1_9ACTN|nr:AAA family ATPase [Actinospica durhamensis]MBR7836564.1 AAA family ATPase [Actinospica durhamensis]
MPENPAAAPVSPLVIAERTHLERSRAALRAMRSETLALRALGGNAVSTEVINSAIQARAAALADRPDVPLFFGRLDYDPELSSEYPGEHFYVGRRHVHDAHGDPMVVDWRAPVSLAFYRASTKEPMGLGLRRRFGFAAGQLTAIEDEPFGAGREASPAAAPTGGSTILRQEIERPRTGPMRDIVATIQPEQDEIVRADLGTSICVQGAPGTGKTAVGLHRVAFLLYAHRDRIKRGGALVVGPNRQFLKYIEQVLPALGEIDVAQATVAELVARAPVRAVEGAAAARLKGDARMAAVLRRAAWAGVSAPAESMTVVRGSRHWRIPAYEIAEHIETLRGREVRYSAGRAMLAQRIAHSVLRRMEAAGESPDDRVQDAVARSRPVKQVVDQVWPAMEPAKVLHALYRDPELLAAAAQDELDEDEQRLLVWDKAPRSAGAAKWTAADVVLLDELADLLERTASLAHVVVDEAQDLSAMQLRAVARRCTTGSVTVLGDIAQATTPWATGSWEAALGHLGKSEAVIEELTQGFRVPRQVIEYAARLLPTIAPHLAPPTSVRQQGGGLDILGVENEAELEQWLTESVREALAGEGSVGVITADGALDGVAAHFERSGIAFTRLDREVDEEDEAEVLETQEAASDRDAVRLVLVPASLAKGLEYDQVIVLEPTAIAEAEHDELLGLRRLYVVLTRAVTRLTVLHARPLPPALAV